MTLQCETIALNQLINDAISTSTKSKVFLKKVVPIVIQNVLFQRIKYPRDDFYQKVFTDIEYSVFKSQLKTRDLMWIRQTIQEAMRALDQNILKELIVFIVSATDSNQVLERHSFAFQQMNENSQSMVQNYKLNRATKLLLATHSLLKSVSSLQMLYTPDKVEVKFMMEFYKLPRELSLEAFRAVDREYTNNLLQSCSAAKIRIGKLQTGHHKLKVDYANEMILDDNSSMDVSNGTITVDD